jgi:hypothetical protein
VIHLAAGLLWQRFNREPSFHEVQVAAAKMLDDLAHSAAIAHSQLGPRQEVLTQAECHLYGMIHDLTHANHTKDYRTSAAFVSCGWIILTKPPSMWWKGRGFQVDQTAAFGCMSKMAT